MHPLISKYLSWNYWRTILFYAVILLVVAIASNLWMTRDQVMGSAPAIYGQAMDESMIQSHLDKLSEPVLIYFFADWCPICSIQHAAIQSIQEDYTVIGVAMQSGSLSNVQNYVKDKAISFQVVNDETGEMSLAYGVNGVPAVFVVDRQGVIQYSTRGYATEVGLRARLLLAQLGD